MYKPAPKSWRTTVAGIAGILAVLCGAIAAALDGDPATTADPQAVFGAIAALLGMIGFGGLIAARDQKAHDAEA